jgi:hypothetical protein
MTTERMLELIILNNLVKRYLELPIESYQLIEERFSVEKVISRRNELEEEFLKPYVIANAEKSE